MSGQPPIEDIDSPETPEPPPPTPRELEEPPPTASAIETAGSFWADWQALLRNRLILGGLAALVLLLLVAIVLVLIGSDGDDETTPRPLVATTPREEEPTVLPSGGLIGRMRTTASVRRGPAATYEILGTVRGGAVVTVVGRNEDETWLQLIYPPGSELRGWVNATLIEVTGDVSRLVIAGPSAGPSVAVPTSPFFNPTFEPLPTEPGGEPTEPAEPTETPRRRPTNTPRPTRTPTPTPAPEETPTPKILPTDTPVG